MHQSCFHTSLKNVLRRNWYQAKLVIDWHYKQRREEVCSFKIVHDTNFPLTRPAKKIKLHVQPLENMPISSFFKTDRGKAVLEHAVKVAEAHMEASWRMAEVVFEVPIEEGFTISLEHKVNLQNILGLGSEIWGKVIAYKLSHTQGIPTAWIRVGIALQNGTKQNEPCAYATGAVLEEYAQEHTHFYHPLCDFQPRGIRETNFLHTTAMIHSITVTNNAEIQENLLLNPTDGSAVYTKELLQKHPTLLNITLQDLRTEGVLRENIYLGEVIVKSHTNLNMDEVLYAH